MRLSSRDHQSRKLYSAEHFGSRLISWASWIGCEVWRVSRRCTSLEICCPYRFLCLSAETRFRRQGLLGRTFGLLVEELAGLRECRTHVLRAGVGRGLWRSRWSCGGPGIGEMGDPRANRENREVLFGRLIGKRKTGFVCGRKVWLVGVRGLHRRLQNYDGSPVV